MNRKSEKFFDAITRLREDLIEEAQNYQFRKKYAGWKKFGSLAACIVLVMSIGFLAVLPRGCGGSSGGADSNSSSAPLPSPQEAPPSGDSAPPLYGDNGFGEPESDPEGSAPDSSVRGQFTAVVVEVREDAVLVESIELDSYYQYLIPLSNPEFPALTEGDWITVTYAGRLIFTSNPPVIPNVQSIEKIDPVD